MNFNSIKEIKAKGFIGFEKMSDLFEDKSSIPKIKGVYMVLYLDKKYPEFISIGSGPSLYKKKINPNVSIQELKSNWMEGTIVINIGKAGGLNQKGVEGQETLRSRLSTYFSFGQGNDVRHYGGRLIWQLKDSKDLVVCWKKMPEEEPRDIEQNLIKEFSDLYGQRPFANLQD